MELRRRVNGVKLVLLVTAAQLLAAVFSVSIIVNAAPVDAAQTVPYKINFQGRLTDNSGNALADGLYNVKFRLWNALTSGSNVWEGDRIITAADRRIQLTGGLFNIQFGDTANGDPALSPALFSNGTFPLYLEVELPTPATASCATNACGVFTEGAMTPRQPLASTPYAFNSDTLDGLDSSAFAQLGTANTGSLTVTGALQGATANFTGGSALTLGSTTNVGSTIFNDGTANARSVTLNVQPLIASYTLSLPSTGPGLSQCLLSGSSTASQLTFGACTAGGANVSLSNLNTVAINVNLLPGVTNVVDAGSVALAFRTGYFGTSLLTPNVDSPTAGTLLLGSATATAITLGKFGVTTTTAGSLTVNSGTNIPTVDQVVIDNSASTGVTTGNADGLNIRYRGGNAAVEAAGLRVDFTPGGTTGGIWSGVRIVANANGPATGVTSYGIKLEGPTIAGTGTGEGVYIGTGWDIGLDLQSGGIQLAAQTDPVAPTANNLRIYAKNIAGRMLPKWIAPSGVDTPFQSSFGFNRIAMMAPNGNGTTSTTIMTNWGTNFINLANIYANPPLVSTSLTNSVRRARMTTATNSTTAIAYHLPSALMAWRGNAAGLGGFFYTIRFSYATLTNTNGRAFVGLIDSVTAPISVDPTTSTTAGKLGIAITSNTGNLKWINNVVGTVPTVTDLGTSYPINTTDMYELIIYSPPNGSGITYRVQNISTGATLTNTSVTTNIPTSTTFLAPNYWIADGGTAGAEAIDCAGWYLESDN